MLLVLSRLTSCSCEHLVSLQPKIMMVVKQLTVERETCVIFFYFLCIFTSAVKEKKVDRFPSQYGSVAIVHEFCVVLLFMLLSLCCYCWCADYLLCLFLIHSCLLFLFSTLVAVVTELLMIVISFDVVVATAAACVILFTLSRKVCNCNPSLHNSRGRSSRIN